MPSAQQQPAMITHTQQGQHQILSANAACVCNAEKSTKARHRQERQKQRHNQNHQQTNNAKPGIAPYNNTAPVTI